MAVPSTFRLVRPEDHVILEVAISNLGAVPVTPDRTQPSPFVLKPPPNTGNGTLRVRFPAQQVIEYAGPATGARTVQPKPIFTPRTEVVASVPANDPGVPLSVAGILQALDRLPLEVTGATGTRFALPHRLAIRPHATTTRLQHLAVPARRTDRTELWHSEVSETDPDPATPGLPVVFDHIPESTSTTSEWKNVVRDDLILSALRLDRTDELAKETQPSAGVVVPAQVNRLRLSSLGGWLDVRGSWPTFPEYLHIVDMGRDRQVRVVETGRLFPFGHTAILTGDTTRSFETTGGGGNPTGRAAALATVNVVGVTNPTVTFPIDAETRANAAWPWESVTISETTSDPGIARAVPATPSSLSGVRVLRVNGQAPAATPQNPTPAPAEVPYAFTCVGVDRAGMTTSFSMPMLFVPDSVADTPANRKTLHALLGTVSVSATAIPLGGQPLAVAPPVATGNGARAEAGPAPTPGEAAKATTVLATTLSTTVNDAGQLVTKEITGRVEALERYTNSGPTQVALSYAKPYLDNLFGAANAQGQLFLQLAKGTAVDLAKQASASVGAVNLPVAALSRELGALSANLERLSTDPETVVADRITALAAGNVDLSFLKATDKLLGFVPLDALIPQSPTLKIADTQKITTTVKDGVATTRMFFRVPLLRADDGKGDKPLRFSYVSLAPFRRNSDDPHDTTLTVDQTTTLDTATGAVTSTSVATITSVSLKVHASQDEDDTTALVTVPFTRIVLTSQDGEKPEVDVDLGPVRFGGFLAFLGMLADLIDQAGFNDPPALAVDDTGITSSFEFPIPSVAIGMFSLENISFGTRLRLPFTGDTMSLTLNFASRTDPFVVTVAALGGGGYLEIVLTTGGLESITGSLEFGARLSIDLVVAKASVEAMGGVYASYVRDVGITVTAYFRIHGELDVLSLVSVSVTFTLSLTYVEANNELFGKGEIAVNITVLFFSETVVVPIERRFAGRNADPTFAELMAPAAQPGDPDPGPLPWDAYCLAFAAA